MKSSLLAPGLLVALALCFFLVPAAFAETGATSSAGTTETTEETTGANAAAPDPWAETATTLHLRARAGRYRAIAATGAR